MTRWVSFVDETGRSGAGVLTASGCEVEVAAYDQGGTSAMRRLLAAGLDESQRSGEIVPTASLRLLPPVPDPSKIVAAPVNYRDHQAEMNESGHISSLGVFLKAPSSLIGVGSVVRLPYVDRRFDQEGELAVVIGRECRRVRSDDAMDHVAGFTCLLDMTMRGGEDRSVRKSFDTFTPMGPALVTPDEVGPVGALRLQTRVGGVLRQDADLRDLIWDVPALIAYASSVMRLLPGDVVTTGTPAGVGAVDDGDEVEVSIGGVGVLTVTVSREGSTPCPTSGAGRGPVPPTTITAVRERRSADGSSSAASPGPAR